jgi:hypothetical protein
LETFFNEFQDSHFQFHGFPKSTMKQFKEVIEAMKDIEENDDSSTKDGRLQKFYDNYSDFKQKSDQDLDGQAYANQLDSILNKINPELMQKGMRDGREVKIKQVRKLTDEEKIMDIIHGTYMEEIVPVKPRKRHVHKAPFSPHHFSALPPFHDFPPPSSSSPHASSSASSKSWGRTVISIRNPDGSHETRNIEKSPDGSTKTTITKKDAEGNSSTQSYIGDESKGNIVALDQSKAAAPSSNDHNERNLINHDGYKIPCLW